MQPFARRPSAPPPWFCFPAPQACAEAISAHELETETVARELEEALDSLDASSNGQCRKELSQGLVSAGMLLKLTSTHAKRTNGSWDGTYTGGCCNSNILHTIIRVVSAANCVRAFVRSELYNTASVSHRKQSALYCAMPS